jgi:hypothetical protein
MILYVSSDRDQTWEPAGDWTCPRTRVSDETVVPDWLQRLGRLTEIGHYLLAHFNLSRR